MTALAERIEAILELREMSARELGARAGLHESHVGGILRAAPEKQESAAVRTYKQIAKAGGVRFGWLVGGDGPMLEPGTPDPGRLRDRIAIALQRRGMTADELDVALDKRAGFTARTWLRQTRELPSNEDVLAACKVLRVNFLWLRYGMLSIEAEPTGQDATLEMAQSADEGDGEKMVQIIKSAQARGKRATARR